MMKVAAAAARDRDDGLIPPNAVVVLDAAIQETRPYTPNSLAAGYSAPDS